VSIGKFLLLGGLVLLPIIILAGSKYLFSSQIDQFTQRC